MKVNNRNLFLGLGLFFLFYLLYLASLAPNIYWDDSGELITSVSSLGIPHPTGYPLYALLGRLFSLLPLGSLAWRINLLSAVAAAAAVFILWLTSQRFLAAKPVLALIPPLFLGCSPVLWHSGSIAEVYALNAFIFALLLNAYFKSSSDSRLKIFLLIAGLSLGNHLSLVLFLPALLFYFGDFKKLRFLFPRGLLILGLMGGLYLYLPLRSVTLPPCNWGRPLSWDNFYWLVSGQEFSASMFQGGGLAILKRLGNAGVLFFKQFQLGLLLGVWGLLTYWRRDVKEGVFLQLAFWGVTLFTLGYHITPLSDWRAYFLPAWLIWTLFIAVGLAQVKRYPKSYNLLLFLPFVTLYITPSFHLQRFEWAPYREARFILRQVEPNALIVNHDSTRTFSLMYLLQRESLRPGTSLLYAPLLSYDWYLQELQERGVLLPPGNPRRLTQRDYVVSLALLNQRRRPVYGFDWWTEFFPDLVPQGPLFQIVPGGFSLRLRPRIRAQQAAYLAYVLAAGQKISPPLRVVLSSYLAAVGGFFQRHLLFGEAIPDYQRSLSYYPEQVVLSNNLAICLEETRQYEAAINQYRATIKLQPDYTSPYGNLGRLYYKLGKKTEAVAIISEALEINPRGDYAEALRGDLYKMKQGAPLD